MKERRLYHHVANLAFFSPWNILCGITAYSVARKPIRLALHMLFSASAITLTLIYHLLDMRTAPRAIVLACLLLSFLMVVLITISERREIMDALLKKEYAIRMEYKETIEDEEVEDKVYAQCGWLGGFDVFLFNYITTDFALPWSCNAYRVSYRYTVLMTGYGFACLIMVARCYAFAFRKTCAGHHTYPNLIFLVVNSFVTVCMVILLYIGVYYPMRNLHRRYLDLES